MASSGPPVLRFSDQVDVHTFEVDSPRRRRQQAVTETMAKIVTDFKDEQVTEAMLKDAARLFSENYGIWGIRGAGKPGTRVRMNAARLRAQCLPEGARSTYVMVTIHL
ncbi:hypothetical protein F5883DRAFT_682032 [Diaporthe sp. PMI_573]|nr:hypothetical protein F5883DRAFT_682032 [Diaporthaceae sp. PMI_573]